MSRKPSSSLSSASLSKQQSSSTTTDGTRKLKILTQMISQLKKEKKEYEKTNQHLMQSTQMIYEENKILSDAIESRKSYLDKLSDRYLHSEKTIQKQIELNQKMSKVYCSYKTRFNNAEKNSKKAQNDSEYDTKKIDLEIDDIEKSAKFLLSKFSESEKKVNDYKILLSLYSKLININNFLTKQAKKYNLKSSKLQKKIENGNSIKQKLFIMNDKEEEGQINSTKIVLNDITNDLDRCLSIYSQIFLISKKRMLMNSENFEENVKINPNENAIYRKIFSFNDEIDELSRIVGAKEFDYLNGTECEKKYRRIQNLFAHGQFPVYDSDELTDSEKENDEYLEEEEQPEQNLEEEESEEIIKNIQNNVKNINQLENDDVSDKLHKQEKGNKKVKYRKKHFKRQMKLRNLKILKQDVSVQARMSIGSTTTKQQQEKIEVTTQVSGNSLQNNARKCKYTIGNELIMEFLLKELVGESNKETNKQNESVNEKDHDIQLSKNVLKPFFTNPAEFLLEDLEGETDDETDRKNILDFYSDSYNLEESTNSAYFEVEEHQNSYNESNKKYTLGNEFLSEISFGGEESEKVNNKVEYVDHTEQEKKEKISKYCQQSETRPNPKSAEEISSKHQLNKSEPQSVNNEAKEPEKISQTKATRTILPKPNPKNIEDDTSPKNQLNRLEKACKSNQTKKVNNEQKSTNTEELIKAKQTRKSLSKDQQQQLISKPNTKEEEEETEFESLSEKTKQARIPFSQLIHILKGMQQPSIQIDEKATEKCPSLESLPKKIDEDPKKANKTEKSIIKNIAEQKTDLKQKQKDQPEIVKEVFSLLDLEDFSEAPNSPKELIKTQKSEPTTITTKSNQTEQPNQVKLPQQLSNKVSQSIPINSSKNQSINETKLNQKNTKVDDVKTEKTININQPELNTKVKQPKKAKQNKTARSFFVHKVKDRKSSSQLQEEEKADDSADELEKVKQTRIPLTQLVDVLKALHRSGVKIGENEEEENNILEYLTSEREEESEKAIRTEKFILGAVPELTTSSESEQQEKAETSNDILLLLDLEEYSEATKTPKENIKTPSFEQNEITTTTTKSNQLEKHKQIVNQRQTKSSQQISKSQILSKPLPSSDIKPNPKSIDDTNSEFILNGLEKTYKLDLPDKVENEKVNVKTEKSAKTKIVKKSPSKPIHPQKDRLNIISNSKSTEEEMDSEYQLNEFESYSEKTSQARIPLSQLVDFLKALHRSGVKIGENEAEESNELEYLPSEKEEESEKAIKTEKFMLGSVPELTTSAESEQPQLFDLETQKFKLTTTSKPNQLEKPKHIIHLPKGSPQLSARQSKCSIEKRDSSEYLTSEREEESEKAIRTEKFILGAVPELTTSSESEQQEKAETSNDILLLLDLEEYSEATKTPKENMKTSTFEQNEITTTTTKSNALNQLSSNASSTLSVHQNNEHPQSETKIYKLKIEDDLISDSKSIKKETNQINNKKESTKFPVHPPKAKKSARESTYDRSIFYTSMNTLSSLEDEYSNNNNSKVQITVTLKDIGLEGLDSFKPEKTNKIKNRETNSNEKSKKNVCKFDLFTAPSTARRGRPASSSNTKQASLLDSTQKAQKYQAIKPKTTPKCTSKYNENNRTNAGNHNNQMNKCNQEDRSPKRFYNEMTERLPTVLNYNYALPI